MYQERSVFSSVQFDMMVQLDCGIKVLGAASFSLYFVITAGLLSMLDSTTASGYNQDTGEWVELESHYSPTPWFSAFFCLIVSWCARACVLNRVWIGCSAHKKYFGHVFINLFIKVAFILEKGSTSTLCNLKYFIKVCLAYFKTTYRHMLFIKGALCNVFFALPWFTSLF